MPVSFSARRQSLDDLAVAVHFGHATGRYVAGRAQIGVRPRFDQQPHDLGLLFTIAASRGDMPPGQHKFGSAPDLSNNFTIGRLWFPIASSRGNPISFHNAPRGVREWAGSIPFGFAPWASSHWATSRRLSWAAQYSSEPPKPRMSSTPLPDSATAF